MAEPINNVIRLSGRFDFSCFKQFQSQYEPLLANPDIRTIDIDFGQVQYLDSSALGMLMLLRDQADARQKKVRISQAKGMVKDIMEVANLQKRFDFI